MHGEEPDHTWNILLVDDDPDFLHAAQRVLRKGIRANIQTAIQADEALRMLSEKLFDVVVADYRMAPDNGADLLQRVHENDPELKRVLLTGFDQDTLQTMGVASTAADLVLDKNDLLAGLDRKLTDFLESHAPPSRPQGPAQP